MLPTPTSARPTVILATLAAIVITLAVCATAATVIVASDVTREREQLQAHGAVSSISVDDARRSLRSTPALRAMVDTLVTPLAPFTPADSLTITLMTVQWASRTPQHRAVFASSHSAQAPVDSPLATYRALQRVADGLRGDSVLDPDQLSRALADTASDWLGVWRRFARSAPLPALWGYRDGLPGVTSTFDLPNRQYSGARHLLLLNEVAGRHELAAGRHADAITRGLENVAASRHYLDSPIMADFVLGRAFALAGSRLVIDAANAAGNRELLRQARALAQLALPDGASFMALTRAAERDAASPDGALARELFDDEKLPFAVRVEILYAGISGACNHTREVIFGFAPEREARLAELAVEYRNHQTFGTILQLMPPAAKRVRESPTSLLSPDVWPTAGALDALLPDAVAARAVLCQQNL